MRSEWIARAFVLLAVLGAPLALLFTGESSDSIQLRAAMPGASPQDEGGWMPDRLQAKVGIPLELRLTSDDVMHGFAVGRQSWPAVDVEPGRFTELALTFDKPGTYSYYCTRWCGPDHWLMRGTIEVSSDDGLDVPFDDQPLYHVLNLDLDAPHRVDVEPGMPPSGARGEDLADLLPAGYLSEDIYLTRTPHGVWRSLRAGAATAGLSDAELWDLIAFLWRSHATDEQRLQGEALFGVQCAACHGVGGTGDGVMANRGWWDPGLFPRERPSPTDFTDPTTMRGASTALLDGKIRRGGMGSGMPSWLRILTDEEVEALIAYLWNFQFPLLAECCIASEIAGQPGEENSRER